MRLYDRVTPLLINRAFLNTRQLMAGNPVIRCFGALLRAGISAWYSMSDKMIYQDLTLESGKLN